MPHDNTRSVTFPYQDVSVPISKRVSDILQRLTLEDKAGLLFFSMVPVVSLDQSLDFLSGKSIHDKIVSQRITHLHISGDIPGANQLAPWINEIQDVAMRTGFGIPVTFGANSLHSLVTEFEAAKTPFSKWPLPLGIGAINDIAVAQNFGNIMRQELSSVGIRTTFQPQLDIASEPRSPRNSGMLGEDPETVANLGTEIMKGLQSSDDESEWVSAMVKHFPGGGPQRNGEDPHFSYGQDQIYPADQFTTHLEPFRQAINAGARQIMLSYSKPVGTKWAPVGMAFNRGIVTDLLRKELQFEGIICADWGVLQEKDIMGLTLQPSAWGVESLSVDQRLLLLLDAGVDQIGGEQCPELIIQLFNEGRISEKRLDDSVRRILWEKFQMGLFDDPFIDVEKAINTVGRPDFVSAGLTAQKDSIVLLKQEIQNFPLQQGIKVYCEGIDEESIEEYAQPVDSVEEADIALVRLQTPFEKRNEGLESWFHAGSLDFGQEVIEHIEDLRKHCPIIVDIFLERAAILTPLVPQVDVMTVSFGSSDAAWADIVFGRATAKGKLPFDLPRSMDAVKNSREDAPFDTAEPLYKTGYQLFNRK